MIINYVAVSKILTVEDLINDPNFNPEDYYGYIYMTTFLNLNKSYIGKKEAALIEGKGRRPLTEKVKKDSGWKEYYGSEKEVIELSKTEPADKVIRTVLHLCKTKKELSYYELKNLFKYEVLEQPDRYFNGNIAGTYFRKDLNSK
jgi:hypothetical protein